MKISTYLRNWQSYNNLSMEAWREGRMCGGSVKRIMIADVVRVHHAILYICHTYMCTHICSFNTTSECKYSWFCEKKYYLYVCVHNFMLDYFFFFSYFIVYLKSLYRHKKEKTLHVNSVDQGMHFKWGGVWKCIANFIFSLLCNVI